MGYKDKIKQKARDKRYYLKYGERIKKRERDKYKVNREEIRERRKELNTPEKKRNAAEKERIKYIERRLLIIKYYGGKCACCGENEPRFLEIDHINNDGKKHREEIGNSARALVEWIIKNNYPNNVQLLCANCNQGKKRNKGICPHMEVKK